MRGASGSAFGPAGTYTLKTGRGKRAKKGLLDPIAAAATRTAATLQVSTSTGTTRARLARLKNEPNPALGSSDLEPLQLGKRVTDITGNDIDKCVFRRT
jgi:hypothetical protein